MKIESGRQRRSPQPVNPLREGEGKPELNSCAPCDGLYSASAPMQSKNNQSWTGESSGHKMSAFGRHDEEDRLREQHSLCWLLCSLGLINQTVLYLPPQHEEAGWGWIWASAWQQGRASTDTSSCFSQSKKASQGVSSDSRVRKSKRAFVPHTSIITAATESQPKPPVQFNSCDLQGWWVPIPGNVRLSLTTRGCSPSQRQNQCQIHPDS